MPRNDVIVRALRVIRLMQSRKVRLTAPELARALGVSERTAKRYIAGCVEARIQMPPNVHEYEAMG